MATWDDTRIHLRLRWRPERDDATAFTFLCPIQVEQREVLQSIALAPASIHGRPWLAIAADLFPEAGLAARSALLYADLLPFGAIALRDDRYLLRHGVAFDTLRPEELEWTIKVLAHEAVRLRVNLTGPTTLQAHDAFGNYAE